MKRYTKDHIDNKLTTTLEKHSKIIRDARADKWLYGIPVPSFPADPSVPTELNSQVFIYYNTSSHVFRKYVSGSWSNAGI